MIHGFATAFIIAAIVQFYFASKVRQSGRELSRQLLFVFYICAITELVSAVQITTQSMLVGGVMYSLFFAGFDWLLYFLLSFIMRYTGNFSRRSPVLVTAKVAMLIDSLIILSNSFTGIAFYCTSDKLSNGTIYVQYVQMPYFSIHLGLTYIAVGMVLVLLIQRCLTAPASYRRKYYSVLMMIIFVVAIDAVYLILKTKVDFSILGMMFGCMLIYYYAIIYVPADLMNNVMKNMVQDMDDAIIIGDINRELVFINETAYRMIAPYVERSKVTYDILEQWAAEHGKTNKENFTVEWEQVTAEETKTLNLKHSIIYDEKGFSIGSFIFIKDRTAELRELKEEKYKATHDMLTGIYNREYFMECSARLIRENPGERYLMICLNLRNFKLVNEIFGREEGDRIICRIAEGLRRDAGNGEIYGRLINERFALLMKKKRYNDRTFIKAREQILSVKTENHYKLNGYIGIYEVTDPEIPVSVMCDRAFMAMNTIKEKYRSGIVWYDDSIRNRVLRESEIVGRLDNAIATEQFKIFLQPQVTAEGRIEGAEALVRWQDPEKGMISPGEFIPVYEKNGLISKLDIYIWNKAAELLRKWKDQGIDRYISVNISPRDFFFLDLYNEFTAIVERYGIEPSRLKLELTETAIFMNMEKNLELINNLKKAGFTVEMDDFGSGYSSINLLGSVDVDVLKIDMGFLGNTENRERSWTLLRNIVEMARRLGIVVVCEGVEREDELIFLKENGCDIFQGYYFAAPMPVADFEEKYPLDFSYDI